MLPLWFSFLCAAGLFFLVAAVRCFWRGCLLVFALVSSVVAVWPALSWLCPLPPPPPLVCPLGLLVQSVLCWSLPPGIWLYLQRSGCHTFGMACCGWLAPVFTPPHGNKGFGPVWGFALYTMLWVLFMCPSLLHWGIRPWVIQNPLRTPLKLHAPAFLACALFSLLPLLPSRASSLSLFAGLRLPSSPRAPCLVWFCLPASLPFVLVGVCGFPRSCWLGLFFGFVWLVLLGVVCLCLFSRSCVLLL